MNPIPIVLNGAEEAVAAETVRALLEARGIDPSGRGTAVALNGAMVPRARWAEHRLSPGDRVEIVRPFSGG